MTGKVNDKGEGFLGWDTEFDYVESDLTITALYGQKAAEVTIADATGLLTDEADALIFCGGTLDSAAWNGTTKNWATVKGVYTTWKSGATAVFATDATVMLGEAQTVGKVIVLGEAKSVTLSGEALTFADAATVQFNAEAVLKCENNLAGTAGLVVTGDVNSASAALEIAGNYGITGTLTVARAFFKTVGEGTLAGGNFSQDVRIKENGVLSLGATVPQKIVAQTKIEVAKEGEGYVITEKGSQVEISAVTFGSNTGNNWELRIAGVTKASGYSTLPTGGGRTKVLEGGELLLGSTYGYWGPNGGGDSVIVYTNGLLRLTDTDSTGVLSEFLIDGGVVTNEVAKGNDIIYKWLLKNGAVLKGYGMRVGFTDYYGKWSYIKVDGDTPSTVGLDAIEIGYQKSAGNNRYVGIQFQVNDVTGDDETDLYVSSPITEVEGVTYDSGYRGNVGVYKQGAGTLELSSSESSCTTGVFKVEAGTVRFPAKSGGSFGALQVTGDTVIEVAASARVSFDNSSEIAWTAGKKLIFTGDMTGKSVRIGTDANSLTADQLKQVVYRKASGKEVSMSLNAEGYLQPPAKSLTIIIQ